jgi:hypothetical protein
VAKVVITGLRFRIIRGLAQLYRRVLCANRMFRYCYSNSHQSKRLRSSIGDGGDRPPSIGDSGSRQSWEDFLSRDGNESDNLLRAREYISDNSLPLSYDHHKEEIVSDEELW